MERFYRNYVRECAHHLPEPGMRFDEFAAAVGPALDGMARITLSDSADGEGVICYSLRREGALQLCDVPVYGYAASSEKALCRLFSLLAARVLKGGDTRFQVHLYAHDTQALTLFAMMQFGFMAEKGIWRIGPDAPQQGSYVIRTLDKAEIRQRWQELWAMTAAIIRHLQQPPVFYPGHEFTETVYRDFYLDSGTSLHAAFSPEGRLIGIIESNCEADFLVGPRLPSANVGEAYVLPEYRGSGLAHQLLLYAAQQEQARGTACLWVEHGTANPNARRFWGKYFSTYQYELDRVIEAL